MKKLSLVIVMGICLAAAFPISLLKADEVGDIKADLSKSGVSGKVVDDILNGPSGTLGERLQDMLNNGTITQTQYDATYNRLMNLSAEKRQAIKGAYDAGNTGKATKAINQAVRPQQQGSQGEGDSGDASLRRKIKNLKDQGYSGDQIRNRLKGNTSSGDNEAEPSRRRHAKNLRDNNAQQIDKLHEKRQNRRDAIDQGNTPSRRDHIKSKEGLRQRAKDGRDMRRGGMDTQEMRQRAKANRDAGGIRKPQGMPQRMGKPSMPNMPNRDHAKDARNAGAGARRGR